MTKPTFLTLTPQQRQHIASVVRTGQTLARIQTRARILLLLDRSQETTFTDKQIAGLLGCHALTVRNTRRRFLTEGLDAVLTEKPMGPTAPYKMTGELEARIALLACSDAPEGQSRWTLRLLAEASVELGYASGLSHETVRQILKKTKSSPGASKPGVLASPPRSM